MSKTHHTHVTIHPAIIFQCKANADFDIAFSFVVMIALRSHKFGKHLCFRHSHTSHHNTSLINLYPLHYKGDKFTLTFANFLYIIYVTSLRILLNYCCEASFWLYSLFKLIAQVTADSGFVTPSYLAYMHFFLLHLVKTTPYIQLSSWRMHWLSLSFFELQGKLWLVNYHVMLESYKKPNL